MAALQHRNGRYRVEARFAVTVDLPGESDSCR